MADVESVLNPPVRGVQLEGLALMKIVKCCREAMPAPVSGCLLGLLVGDQLEVTHSFATKRVVNPGDEYDNRKVIDAMTACLKDVGVDSNIVGWYQSTPFVSECTPELVETQYQFQSGTPGSVVIVYDPIAAGTGALAIKALRLTQTFMDSMEDKSAAGMAAAGKPLLASGVFEELSLRFHTNPVMTALLLDVAAPAATGKGLSAQLPASELRPRGADSTAPLAGDADCDLDRLEFSSTAYLERHVRLLSEQVTDLAAPVVNAQVWARREAAARKAASSSSSSSSAAAASSSTGQLPPAKRAAAAATQREALLAAAQAGVYCRELSGLSSRNFGKLFLAKALQSSE